MYIPHLRRQPNAFAYLLWSFLWRNNGKLLSFLDSWFFGPSRGLNDYAPLANEYKNSDQKPDKQYSILPTVLKIVGNVKGKIVLDIGCGAGFFTLPLAELGCSRVYGVDNSEEQLSLAVRWNSHPSVSYHKIDVFDDNLPKADIILVPFVLNYARTISILRHFLAKLYEVVNPNGKIVFVIDLPNGKNLKRFGALKSVSGSLVDEAKIQIRLFKADNVVCDPLNAIYYTPSTIERLLREVGFKNIEWHKPIISQEGVEKMGEEFWSGYLDDPELGYISAEK